MTGDIFISCCVIVVIGVEGGAAGYSIVDLTGDERKEKPLVIPPAAATPDPTALPPLLPASLFIDPAPPLLLPPPRNPKDDLVLSSSTTGGAGDDGVARNEKPLLFAIVVEVGNADIDNDSMGASDDAKKLNADDIIPSLTDCCCCFDALPLLVSPVAVLSLFVILGA
jgi:hypothetical protein